MTSTIRKGLRVKSLQGIHHIISLKTCQIPPETQRVVHLLPPMTLTRLVWVQTLLKQSCQRPTINPRSGKQMHLTIRYQHHRFHILVRTWSHLRSKVGGRKRNGESIVRRKLMARVRNIKEVRWEIYHGIAACGKVMLLHCFVFFHVGV
jgi:hypothetical protein